MSDRQFQRRTVRVAKKDGKQFFNKLLKEAQVIEEGLKRTVNGLPIWRRAWIAHLIVWRKWL